MADIQASDVGKGWYVQQVITDLQSGKVDEFVKKEGKWFNYIKGESTTFANAADSGGTPTGNVDFAEFTVQGIGTLSGDATVSSGTTPSQGADINIVFEGSGEWNTTGYQVYNVTSIPSSDNTFTIYPNAGFGISAAEFSISNNENWITSVSFANTGTPGTPSNTVVGTITFDPTQLATLATTLDGGVDVYDLINLTATTVPAVLVWEGVVVFNGVFQLNPNSLFGSIYSGPQDTILWGGSYLSITNIASSPTQQIWGVQRLIQPGISNLLLDITIGHGPNTFWNTATTQPTIDITQFQDEEDLQYSSNTTGSGATRLCQVDYYPASPYQANDNNNVITVNLNTTEGVTYFTTMQNPYALSSGVYGQSSQAVLLVYSTLGPFTAAFIGDGSDANDDVVINSISQDYDSASNMGTVTIDYVANNTDDVLTGLVSITANNNTTGTPNDILNVSHPIFTVVTVKSSLRAPFTGYTWGAFTYEEPAGISGNGWYDGLTGANSTPIVPSEGAHVIVKAEFSEMNPDDNNPNEFEVIYDDPNNVDWIVSVGGGELLADNSVVHTYEVSEQPVAGVQRSATIKRSYWSDPTNTGSVSIVQENAYASTVNTLTLQKNTGGVTFVDAGDVIEIDNAAQTLTLYADIPNADELSDNPFTPNSFQTPTSSIAFPSSLEYFINEDPGDGQLDYGADLSVYITEPWILNTTPNWALTGLPYPLPKYKLEIPITQNYNVEGFSDPDFPINREVVLKAYNPENPVSIGGYAVPPDDTVTIRQTAPAHVTFNTAIDNSGVTINIPNTYNSTNGYSLIAKANGSTPISNSYHEVVQLFASNIDGEIEASGFNIVQGVPEWLTATTIVSTGNDNEYNISLSLDENWSGYNREFRLGLWHSTTVDPLTINPAISPNNSKDFVDIVMTPAAMTINVITEGVTNTGSSTVWLTSQVGEGEGSGEDIGTFISEKYQIIVANNAAGTVSVPIAYNGASPVLSDLEYAEYNSADGTITAFTPADSSDPSWVDGNLSFSANTYGTQLNIPLLTGDSGTGGDGTRVLQFKIAHGENNAAYHDFNVILL